MSRMENREGNAVKMPANQGRLCVKGRFAYDFIYSETDSKRRLSVRKTVNSGGVLGRSTGSGGK